MTYCLGVKLKSGLLAMSDSCITTGSQSSTASKLRVYQRGSDFIFLMTSGLRSVRDKVLCYFDDWFSVNESRLPNRLYEVVNAFGEQLKRVAKEDRDYLQSSGYDFNLNAIVGGKFANDSQAGMYLVYPEGNWIEVTESTPYAIIGNSGYGTPILARTLSYDSTLKFALKTGFLSFDSTRKSANDVDYPLDVLIYNQELKSLQKQRLDEEQMRGTSEQWEKLVTESVRSMDDTWMEAFALESS